MDRRWPIEEASQAELAERLRLALDIAGIGEWTWNAVTDALSLSPIACAIYGVARDQEITWSDIRSRLMHAEDAPLARDAMAAAIEERQPYNAEYRIRRPGVDQEAWVLARGRIRYDDQGAVLGMVGVVRDITGRKREQAGLAEEIAALDILNRTGAVVASEVELEKVVQAVTDAGVAITGAQFGAFFYNVIAAGGEQYMLYTLSGAPREAFSRFPMPRNTPIFAPTFMGTGIVRSDDITRDPRYGTMAPHHGMPKGHLPVRSYLAVPVISRSGEVVGGLFFGHGQTGRFDARDERVMAGVAAHAAIGIDNARLYQQLQKELAERRQAEAALRSLAEGLEVRVRDRTSELEAAHRERESAEEALRHAQKIEAIGQLTGGIAHDFNNLLTVVIGNLDILQRRTTEHDDARVRRAASHAFEGAKRAASLTQRLLAFARRQPLDPRPVDPNKLVQGMSDMLRRTLGEQIEVEIVLSAGVWLIEVDVPQLENAILNLALNARDAMPTGGKMTIELAYTRVDYEYARSQGMTQGQYVMLSLSDTGSGIPKELIDRVIEPFFTTKPIGTGTGLGLSQVYGFVKQSGGNLRIYSEPDDGTTIKIYLPRFMGAAPEPVAAPEPLPADRGETVLVVEDDASVRTVVTTYFEDLGYKVLEAPDGYVALNLIDRGGRIDLLFTDVGLPKMNGRQLAEEARRRRPKLKVLFTTGYARNAIVHQGRLDPGVELIVKPFTYEELSEKVRFVLDSPVDVGP